MIKIIEKLARLADLLDESGEFELADRCTAIISTAAKDRGDCVFPSTHPKVNDGRDHFPVTSKNQAANALARANQYSSAPEWFDGSLKELLNAVSRKVKSKYPGIKQSPASKKPGKE